MRLPLGWNLAWRVRAPVMVPLPVLVPLMRPAGREDRILGGAVPRLLPAPIRFLQHLPDIPDLPDLMQALLVPLFM